MGGIAVFSLYDNRAHKRFIRTNAIPYTDALCIRNSLTSSEMFCVLWIFELI